MEIAYVTSQGRLAVPSRLRRKYGIKPGTKICFIESDGEILARSNPRLEPIPLRSSERVIFTCPERDGSAAALLGALNVPASHLRRETLVPAGKQSKGTCAYCGQELTMGGTAKHLTACPERETVIDKAERKKTGSETLYHLGALDMWRSEFWLDLEMRGSSTLKDLDFYLRGI